MSFTTRSLVRNMLRSWPDQALLKSSSFPSAISLHFSDRFGRCDRVDYPPHEYTAVTLLGKSSFQPSVFLPCSLATLLQSVCVCFMYFRCFFSPLCPMCLIYHVLLTDWIFCLIWGIWNLLCCRNFTVKLLYIWKMCTLSLFILHQISTYSTWKLWPTTFEKKIQLKDDFFFQ